MMDWGDEAEAWHSLPSSDTDMRSPSWKGNVLSADDCPAWLLLMDGCDSSEAATDAGGDEADHGEEMAAEPGGTAKVFIEPNSQFREPAFMTTAFMRLMNIAPAAGGSAAALSPNPPAVTAGVYTTTQGDFVRPLVDSARQASAPHPFSATSSPRGRKRTHRFDHNHLSAEDCSSDEGLSSSASKSRRVCVPGYAAGSVVDGERFLTFLSRFPLNFLTGSSHFR